MTNVGALSKELETFEKHKAELLGTAKGKFVLIKGDKIIGTYESQVDAVNQGYKDLGVVPFLVKKVEEIETPMNFTTFKIAL